MSETLSNTSSGSTVSRLPGEGALATGDISDTDNTLRTLREALGNPACDFEVILGAIAEAAHALTGGDAAALAMRREGAVVCVARSGELAPELGARLSVDSGISGECLRTGNTLRCDNTQRDYRVDPLVCVRLGLASIAAVPLKHRQQVVGILETFSTRPYAFAEEHVHALQELALLAERAYVQSSGIAVDEPPSPGKVRLSSTIPLLARKMATRFSVRTWLYITAGAVAAMVLLFSLITWHSPAPGSTAQASQVPSATASPENVSVPVAGATLTWSAKTASAASSKPSTSAGKVQQAAKIDKDNEVSPDLPSQDEPAATEPLPSIKEKPDPLPAEKVPPAIVASNDHSPIGSVLAPEPAIPRFTTPVSQGVVDGTLTRKVVPIYPKQAIPLRLSGAVVLDGTITEEGNVRDLNVVSGNLTLAQAAVEAVKQWRYKPYLLNGKAVPMKTRITVDFKAPQ